MNRNGRRGFDGPDARHRTRRTAFAYPGWAAPTTGAVAIVGGGGAVLGALLAFPFAQGYKVNSTLTGGRSLGAGVVRKVTNLNNSGAGSYRAAVESAGPADVVFEVAGKIELDSYIKWASDITVWGETAPSPGIAIIDHTNTSILSNAIWGFKQDGADPTANNIVLRHLRLRQRHDHATLDTSNVYIGNGSGLIIFANCSFAYSSDEGIAILGNSEHDITFYRCLLGPTAYGACKNMLIGGGNPATVDRIALIQNANLLSLDRNPEQKPGVSVARYNDYIYACGNGDNSGTCSNGFFSVTASDGINNPSLHVSVRGCRYEANGSYNRPQIEYDFHIGDNGHQSYFNDNVGIVRCVESPAVVTAVANESDLAMTLPEVATVLSSSGIKAYVLARVGARPLDRDQVDTDVVANANAGTGSQNTGAPPVYSLGSGSATFNTPASPFAQAAGEAAGWRNLDKYIYQNYTLAVEA